MIQIAGAVKDNLSNTFLFNPAGTDLSDKNCRLYIAARLKLFTDLFIQIEKGTP